MSQRIYNFSAGPAVLPVDVLEQARESLLDFEGTRIGIMEHSHRGSAFMGVLNRTIADCRQIANIPEEYHVLFIQGGASTQFFAVPMNLLNSGDPADYLVTGAWSEKAVEQAKAFGKPNVVASSSDRNFCYIPRTVNFSPDAKYVHFTSNNTIFGTQFATEPDSPHGAPLICDASSDIFSRPIEIRKYGLIYAGAQKNLGPSGVTLVIVHNDLVKAGRLDIPEMVQYRTYAENESCYNTPPTFGIYVMGLVFQWILKQGGLKEVGDRNDTKAALLYDYLDQSKLFRGTADDDSRSKMNVTFVTGDAELDKKFISEATAAGFDGLKGHRSVGGMRASIYNAFPVEGVSELVKFMQDFEAKHL